MSKITKDYYEDEEFTIPFDSVEYIEKLDRTTQETWAIVLSNTTFNDENGEYNNCPYMDRKGADRFRREWLNWREDRKIIAIDGSMVDARGCLSDKGRNHIKLKLDEIEEQKTATDILHEGQDLKSDGSKETTTEDFWYHKNNEWTHVAIVNSDAGISMYVDGEIVVVSRNPRDITKKGTIVLTEAEIQSGHDRVKWAEGLIMQLPSHHEGRNSWLLNYGVGDESVEIRKRWREKHPNMSQEFVGEQCAKGMALLFKVKTHEYRWYNGVIYKLDEDRLEATRVGVKAGLISFPNLSEFKGFCNVNVIPTERQIIEAMSV